MKKRLLLLSVILVMLLSTLTPYAALADNGKSSRPQEFTGTGLLYVTYMPAPIIKGPIWRFQGEIVEGFLDQCDWGMLQQTFFYSEHDSVVNVKPDGTTHGVMTGTFSMSRPDGSGSIEGTFTGRIRGNMYTYIIMDEGSWISTSGTGVFENVSAWGKWSADLSFNGMTLAGPLTWEGRYQTK
ncbi:MAG: hypothetical protein PHR56_04390 [Dehalococcoidales bacterium]|nr:hypothetical protein [Dehalococcoidales bacterium]